MDFEYGSKVTHNGVEFYVSNSGNQAFMVFGGCVIGVCRPVRDNAGCGMVKFGLALRGVGCGYGAPTLGGYILSELKRRGMHRKGFVSCDAKNVFLDALDLMNCDSNCGALDLCGHFDVLVRDPYAAQHIVSMSISSGIVVSSVTDSPTDRVLRLHGEPRVSNAYSGFVYDVDPDAFEVVQASVQNPPESLLLLTEGLFDGIPCNRAALKDSDVPDRVNVIITGTSAARSTTMVTAPPSSPFSCSSSKTTAAAKKGTGIITLTTSAGTARGGGGSEYADQRHSRRGNIDDGYGVKKSAKICPYVQVRYIDPVLDIWKQTERSQFSGIEKGRGVSGRTSIRKSLSSVWSCYCRVTSALDLSGDPWCDLSNKLYEARGKMAEAAEAVFGRSSPPFVPPAYRRDCTTAQKFFLLQYVHHVQGMPSCYCLLEELCVAYGEDPDADPDPPIDRDSMADLITEVYRYCAFLGAAVETVAVADHRSADFLNSTVASSPSTDACMDSDFLLTVVEETLDSTCVTAERDLRLLKLAEMLDVIYGGKNMVSFASQGSRGLGNSELLCLAIDIESSSAFDDCVDLGQLCFYSTTLVDARLKDANLPSFYD